MSPDSQLRRVVRELRRRSLLQVLGIYLVGAWVAYQVILDLVEGLGLPEWFPPFAVVLFLIGLPMVVATAFVQDASPGDLEDRDGSSHADRTPAELPSAGPGSAVPGGGRGAARQVFTWRNTILGGVTAMALWGTFAAGWIVLGGGSTEPVLGPGERAPSVAVLPFTAIGSDTASRIFGAGIHEDVITQLSRIRGLKVISRTSVLRYADRSDLDLRDVAEELGVSTVLEGSVRRHDDRIRIVAQLIDAETDGHLWADSYDRDLDDVFAIQSEIARQIADALAVTLSPDERARIERRPTTDRRAYQLYLTGRHFWNQRSADGLREAIRQFQAAIDHDPAYADAWAGLADAYVLLPYYAGADPQAVIEEVHSAAERALSLDPSLGAPHATLGLVRTDWERDLAAGEASYRRAIDLNPGDATAHQWLALNLWFQGRIDDAIANSDRALELDPLAPVIRENAMYYLIASGRPEAAIAMADELDALAPAYDGEEDNAAIALAVMGEYEDAEAMLRTLGEGTGSLTQMVLAHVLDAQGRTDEVRHILRTLERRAETEFVSPGILAAVAEYAREPAQAAAYRVRAERAMDPWHNFVAAIRSLLAADD